MLPPTGNCWGPGRRTPPACSRGDGHRSGARDSGLRNFCGAGPNLTGWPECRPGVEENQRVSVFIKSIQPERRKIKLLIIDALEPGVEYTPLSTRPHQRTRRMALRLDADLTRSQ